MNGLYFIVHTSATHMLVITMRFKCVKDQTYNLVVYCELNHKSLSTEAQNRAVKP